MIKIVLLIITLFNIPPLFTNDSSSSSSSSSSGASSTISPYIPIAIECPEEIARGLSDSAYSNYMYNYYSKIIDTIPLCAEVKNLILSYCKPVTYEQWKNNNKELLKINNLNNVERIKELLESGEVDVNIKCPNGQSALFYASVFGHEEIVKLLLEHPDIKINETNFYGDTALHVAAHFGHLNIVNLLLEHNADVNIRKPARGFPTDNFTPLESAKREKHEEIVKLIEDHISKKTASGKS